MSESIHYNKLGRRKKEPTIDNPNKLLPKEGQLVSIYASHIYGNSINTKYEGKVSGFTKDLIIVQMRNYKVTFRKSDLQLGLYLYS